MKKNQVPLIFEIIGWYGTVAIVLAYFLNSLGFIVADSLVYQFLNLTGGIGIIVITAKKGVYQSVVLNTIWSVIAIIAIARILLR